MTTATLVRAATGHAGRIDGPHPRPPASGRLVARILLSVRCFHPKKCDDLGIESPIRRTRCICRHSSTCAPASRATSRACPPPRRAPGRLLPDPARRLLPRTELRAASPRRAGRRRLDAQSVHCLLRAKQSGQFIGCIRLILSEPGDSAALFPFEKTCAAMLDRQIVDPAKLERSRVAEVSRLAVINVYRRRKGGGGAGHDPHRRLRYARPTTFSLRTRGPLSGHARAGPASRRRNAVHDDRTAPRPSPVAAWRAHPTDRWARRASRSTGSVMLSVRGTVKSFGPIVRPLYDSIAAEIDAGYGVTETASAA